MTLTEVHAETMRNGPLLAASRIILDLAVSEYENITLTDANYEFASGVLAGCVRAKLFPLDLPAKRLDELLSMLAVVCAPLYAKCVTEHKLKEKT
jgi:hypothetical protein